MGAKEMTNEFELIDNTTDTVQQLNIKKLISSYEILDGYTIVPCNPATGILFISKDNPGFFQVMLECVARTKADILSTIYK
jgi:hypothetical protein